MTDIEFVGPPPPKRGPGREPIWPGRLAQVKQRPGEWARFGGYSPTSVWTIVHGLRALAPEGDFESAARVEDGVGFVYLRYVGEVAS